MIQLKQMGEAKAARTKNQILHYGGLLVQVSMGRNDLTQWASPDHELFVSKETFLHLPKRQGSLRSYFRKDYGCRAVSSVFPQLRRGRQHSSGCCRFCFKTPNVQHRTNHSGATGLPARGRQSEWTPCLGPGHYSPPTLSCNYKP